MKSISYLLLQFLIFTAALPGYSMNLGYPCGDARDSGAFTQSYNQNETEKILHWAVSCFPEHHAQFRSFYNASTYNSSGELVATIEVPIFVMEEVIEDPESLYGSRLRYTNPESYSYPIKEILKDPTTAPCNVPEGYSLVASCPSEFEGGEQ